MKKKVIIVLVALLVVALGGVVALALSIDSGVETAVEEGGSHALKVPVTLDEADVSLTGGRASLKGFAVANPEGFGTEKAISLGEITTEIKLSSLTSEVIEVPEIVIRKPKIAIKTRKLGLGGTNLTQLLKNLNETVEEYSSPGEEPAGKPEEEPAGEPQHYKVGRILISGATISVSDTMFKGELPLTLPDIEVPGLSTEMTMTQIIKKCLRAMVDSAKKQDGRIAKLVAKADLDALKGKVRSKVEDLKKSGKSAVEDLKKTGKGALEDLKKGGESGKTPGDVVKGAGEDVKKTIKGIGDIFKKKDPEEKK